MEFQITITDKLRNFSDYVEIKQTQENGVVLGVYQMALNDFIESLSSANTGGVKYESPFLPNNCVKYISSVTDEEVFIELPKRQWKITYGGKQMMLGFPRLILKYYVYKNHIQNLKIVAIKDKGHISEDTDIFYFPYSNVHHESGDVCMGDNVFPKIDNLVQLEKMHFLFFSAPFGLDYGAMTLGGNSLVDLFKKFEDKPFQDDCLIPMKKSFREFFLLGN